MKTLCDYPGCQVTTAHNEKSTYAERKEVNLPALCNFHELWADANGIAHTTEDVKYYPQRDYWF